MPNIVLISGISLEDTSDLLKRVLAGEDGTPPQMAAVITAPAPALAPPRRIGRQPSKPGDTSIRGTILDCVERLQGTRPPGTGIPRGITKLAIAEHTGLEHNQVTQACSKLVDAGRLGKREAADGSMYFYTKA